MLWIQIIKQKTETINTLLQRVYWQLSIGKYDASKRSKMEANFTKPKTL